MKIQPKKKTAYKKILTTARIGKVFLYYVFLAAVYYISIGISIGGFTYRNRMVVKPPIHM